MSPSSGPAFPGACGTIASIRRLGLCGFWVFFRRFLVLGLFLEVFGFLGFFGGFGFSFWRFLLVFVWFFCGLLFSGGSFLLFLGGGFGGFLWGFTGFRGGGGVGGVFFIWGFGAFGIFKFILTLNPKP